LGSWNEVVSGGQISPGLPKNDYSQIQHKKTSYEAARCGIEIQSDVKSASDSGHQERLGDAFGWGIWSTAF
jgi:hypothetical protein